MKTLWKAEKDQWIPQEISYSLKEITHNGTQKSKSNALIYVILPDKCNSYDYFIQKKETYRYDKIFSIMKNNLNNYKYGGDINYAVIVKWDTFLSNYSNYINMAIKKQESIFNYNVCKQI